MVLSEDIIMQDDNIIIFKRLDTKGGFLGEENLSAMEFRHLKMWKESIRYFSSWPAADWGRKTET